VLNDIATASLVLSGLVVLVAAGLAWREWSDRLDRSDDLSPEDARHFEHQDARRMLGLVVLVLLAVGLVVGSRVPHKVGGQTNTQFLLIWLGIFLLIFLLLTLAMIDWVALRIFARRHRNQILRERIEILKEEARLKKARETGGNGHANGSVGDLFGP
jgi:UDP-N-acetylmuramyl pentapeptide phosphotransferase/UDP-N-acetylglucosamine-1-phosphate transferase